MAGAETCSALAIPAISSVGQSKVRRLVMQIFAIGHVIRLAMMNIAAGRIFPPSRRASARVDREMYWAAPALK